MLAYSATITFGTIGAHYGQVALGKRAKATRPPGRTVGKFNDLTR